MSQMTDEKYQQLEEKYNKKCVRVSELLKKYKNLESRCDETSAWGRRCRGEVDKYENKCNIFESILEKNYYKVTFYAKTVAGLKIEVSEIIFSCHPRIAVLELEQKEYVNFELISIEKMA
jgi:hypothetical protein